jgi:hypothetical protein
MVSPAYWNAAHRFKFTISWSMSSAVVIVFEFAWKARW